MIEPVEKLRKRARTAYKTGDYQAAAAFYDRLRQHPEHGDSAEEHLEHALALIRSDRPAEAEKVLRNAAQLNPEDAAVRLRLGHLLMRNGHPLGAVENFREAARISPEVADHHWQLAVAERSVGNEAGVDAAVEACLAADPAHPEAREMAERRREAGPFGSSGKPPSQREAGDAAFASVAQFVHSRPVEDVKPPSSKARSAADPLLTLFAGAVAFMVLYLCIRLLLF